VLLPKDVAKADAVLNESRPCRVGVHGVAVANHPKELLRAARDDVNAADIGHKANSFGMITLAPHKRNHDDVALSTLSVSE
jgi:hypothetical protein